MPAYEKPPARRVDVYYCPKPKKKEDKPIAACLLSNQLFVYLFSAQSKAESSFVSVAYYGVVAIYRRRGFRVAVYVVFV